MIRKDQEERRKIEKKREREREGRNERILGNKGGEKRHREKTNKTEIALQIAVNEHAVSVHCLLHPNRRLYHLFFFVRFFFLASTKKFFERKLHCGSLDCRQRLSRLFPELPRLPPLKVWNTWTSIHAPTKPHTVSIAHPVASGWSLSSIDATSTCNGLAICRAPAI